MFTKLETKRLIENKIKETPAVASAAPPVGLEPTTLRLTAECSTTELRRQNVGDDLFSQEAALQVSSARMSLTTVFGMGTGGTSAL